MDKRIPARLGEVVFSQARHQLIVQALSSEEVQEILSERSKFLPVVVFAFR